MNAGMKTGQKTFITYECWYENWTKDLQNLWMLVWKPKFMFWTLSFLLITNFSSTNFLNLNKRWRVTFEYQPKSQMWAKPTTKSYNKTLRYDDPKFPLEYGFVQNLSNHSPSPLHHYFLNQTEFNISFRKDEIHDEWICVDFFNFSRFSFRYGTITNDVLKFRKVIEFQSSWIVMNCQSIVYSCTKSAWFVSCYSPHIQVNSLKKSSFCSLTKKKIKKKKKQKNTKKAHNNIQLWF